MALKGLVNLSTTQPIQITDILDPVCNLGEGLFIKSEMVFWLDINSSKLFIYLESKLQIHNLPVQATVIFDLRKQDLILGSMLEIGSFNILSGHYQKISLFSDKMLTEANPLEFRTNDGGLMDDGLYIFGTMRKDNSHEHKGNLYMASLKKLWTIDHLHIPNSFIQHPDGDILISDSHKKIIWKYKFDHKNFISKCIFKKFDHEVPDGGCIVDNKFLFIAMYNSAAIYVISLSGEFLYKINVPMLHPTNCKYDKSSKKLWITSAYSTDDKSNFSGKTISIKI